MPVFRLKRERIVVEDLLVNLNYEDVHNSITEYDLTLLPGSIIEAAGEKMFEQVVKEEVKYIEVEEI